MREFKIFTYAIVLAIVALCATSCDDNDALEFGAQKVVFSYPDYAAEWDSSTLVRLPSGALYDKYHAKYKVPIYHVTYVKIYPTMSILRGLTPYYAYDDEADREWLSYEYGEPDQMIVMDTEKGNGRTGGLIFKNEEGTILLLLLCTLNIEQ